MNLKKIFEEPLKFIHYSCSTQTTEKIIKIVCCASFLAFGYQERHGLTINISLPFGIFISSGEGIEILICYAI